MKLTLPGMTSDLSAMLKQRKCKIHTEMEITLRVINRGVGGGERGKGTENK